MKLEEISDALQSSSLAFLFIDLGQEEIEEKDDYHVLRLKFKTPFAEDEPAELLVVREEQCFVFMIRKLMQSEEVETAARVAHVNDMTRIPKVAWDPDDGEVYIEWTVLANDPEQLPPAECEQIIAHCLRVFYTERHYFLKNQLEKMNKQGLLGESKANATLSSIVKELESDYLPLLRDVVE